MPELVAMRILHFLNHTFQANGHVEVTVDLACGQASQGHDVALVSGGGVFADVLLRNGVQLLDVEGGVDSPLRLGSGLARACRRWRPHIVHAHMVKAAMLARALKPALGFRLVTTIHNSFDVQARLMGVGDRVIAVSDSVFTEMVERGIRRGKLRTVRNGTVGGARRPPKPVQVDSLDHPSITTVAGLHGRKGIKALIEAFASIAPDFPAANLYLVGSGPAESRQAFERQAAATTCSQRIHFLGYRRDPREVLASTDIFVLASHAEPFGLVICEAREMGCAIVATDVGGIPEALSTRGNGLLVPPKDPCALAGAIRRLLADEAMRRRLAARAHANLDDCSVQRMSRDTLRVYEELV